ncbi:MAG: 30S ribosomal protein S9 [Candidatus Tectomicrobia bacterium]|jgi:small subunit ribosomal protein S9|nr:30S ribosomal protein S9 [Candidatus Tectomicrobia bacterium]
MAVGDEVQRWYATGKRKTAVARVWLKPGPGSITVNRRAFETYFPRETSRLVVMQPFDVTEQVGRFDVFATLAGGGISAQAEALRHGISKALLEYNAGLRDRLKRAGFLTRDARAKERKKYGQPGARKRFQFSKR